MPSAAAGRRLFSLSPLGRPLECPTASLARLLRSAGSNPQRDVSLAVGARAWRHLWGSPWQDKQRKLGWHHVWRRRQQLTTTGTDAAIAHSNPGQVYERGRPLRAAVDAALFRRGRQHTIHSHYEN